MEKSLHSKLYEPVRRRLLALRKATGMTVRELARRLGRDPNLVWRLENRERRIDVLELFSWCLACQADPEKEAAGLMREIRRAGSADKGLGGTSRRKKGR